MITSETLRNERPAVVVNCAGFTLRTGCSFLVPSITLPESRAAAKCEHLSARSGCATVGGDAVNQDGLNMNTADCYRLQYWHITQFQG